VVVSERVEQALKAAKQLAAAEHLDFLEAYHASLEESNVLPFDDAWIAVAERRADEIERGEVQSIPGEEVERRLRKRLADHG
jgi:putative addiction module component (TIGR02574 family)